MAPQPRRESLEEVITGYSTTDSSLVFGIIRKAEKLTAICCFNGLQVTVGINMQLSIIEQMSLMGCNLNRLVV